MSGELVSTMKPHNQELLFDSKHHPSNGEMIEYVGGRVTQTAHEDIQSHLVECDECLALFKDVRDFFESHRKDEPIITVDITPEWRALWNRIKDEETTEDRVPDGRRRGFWTSPSVSLAVAAMLLVVLAIGTWAIMQRRQKQQLARQLEVAQQRSAQLQTEQQNLAERGKQLEQENLDLQERVRSAAQSHDSQPVEIRKPELNAPIYDLYARDFSRRSGNESEVNRIKVPSTANSIVLILNGEGLASSSSYGIEILGNSGQAIWRAKGLRRGHLGNFTVTIGRSFLGRGTYRLKIYDKDGKSLAEYLILIE